MHSNGGRYVALAPCAVAIVCQCAIALNPSLDLSQYAHTAWKNGEQFSKGIIFSIAQTPDGYLWLGTEFGLLRFDGVRATPWQPPAGDHLPEVQVRTLRVARDGRLWIGTISGLASWKDSKLTHYPELDGYEVQALLEDREGMIWVGGWAPNAGKLCTIQSGRTECYGEDGRFGSGVTALYEDSGGNLWAAGEAGLWRWNPGPPKFYRMADAANLIFALIESGDGGILIARHDGIIKLKNERSAAYPLPPGLNMRPQRLFRDRDGGLWIGAAVDTGVLHIHEGTTDLFAPAEGLSGGSISCIFEDREGSVWVATGDGLDRFRDFPVPTFSVQQGLASHGIAAVLAAGDGSLWVGTSHGLNRWNKGQITVYRKRSENCARSALPAGGATAGSGAHPSRTAREIIDTGLPEDFIATLFQDDAGKIWVGTGAGLSFFESGRFFPVASIPRGIVLSMAADPAGNVWLSRGDGLFRLVRARLVESIPWAALGRKQAANALLYDAAQHGLWLGFLDGGVGYFKDNHLRASYGRAEGLAPGVVYGFSVDGNGALWAATEGGLSRIKDGRVLTLTSENGLPCNTVHWMMEDDAHSVWLNLACGLVRIARSELNTWASHPKQTIRVTVFDSSDGVKSHRLHGGYNAVVTKSADGRIWFVPFGGLSVIDPQHLAFNAVPPPVHIESIKVNGKSSELKRGMRLPPRVRDLWIDYTALSLVAPEKVRFKYMLEGQDRGRNEVINERQAKYTNLAPGRYRFRVTACNNNGVWNEEGATLEFLIPPAWFQTNWFRALCAAIFLALLWAAYQLRTRQLQERERKFRETVETMPALAFAASADGYRTFVNRRWVEYTGVTVDQASGSGWQAAVHPDDLKRVTDKWRRSMATGQPFEYEGRLRRGADGEYRWFQVRTAPLRDRRGRVEKWCGVAVDIEDRKRAEQLQAELAHTNRVSLLGELAASISHELKQPITGTMANARASMRWLNREHPDLQEALSAIGRIERDGARASEIIERLRSLYKKTPPKRELVDVNEIIGEMVLLLRGEAHRHAVSIRTDLGIELPRITADRVQLQQVLMNVMLNAIEAMKETGGVLTVKSQRDENRRVLISVSDTGVGLPADEADQIFNAFFTTKPQGSGMGLAISRSIIESHGGRLWATPNDGRGATFSFTLPCEMAAHGMTCG